MTLLLVEVSIVAGLVILLCDDLADAFRYWPYPVAFLATLHLMIDGPGWLAWAAGAAEAALGG